MSRKNRIYTPLPTCCITGPKRLIFLYACEQCISHKYHVKISFIYLSRARISTALMKLLPCAHNPYTSRQQTTLHIFFASSIKLSKFNFNIKSLYYIVIYICMLRYTVSYIYETFPALTLYIG